jgi:hypothetical protein
MTMTKFRLIAVLSLFLYAPLLAQPPELPGPTPEHEWLQQFVGRWTTEAEGSFAPDSEPMKCKGTIDSRMLGKFWVVNEMEGDMMGEKMKGLQTIGYDAAKKKYIGTWVDSVVGHMWHYEGSVDDTGKILTLEAEGPNLMADGKLTKFRDSYEFASPDHIIARSSMLGEDGQWTTFMTGHSHRVK